ncbi:hypothetical protein KAF44_34165 [Cupriavidus necator]|nr:hypothetical protein KAF44_34165 [Cupriavidus necator]
MQAEQPWQFDVFDQAKLALREIQHDTQAVATEAQPGGKLRGHLKVARDGVDH